MIQFPTLCYYLVMRRDDNMTKQLVVAIVGATGAVGSKIMEKLN